MIKPFHFFFIIALLCLSPFWGHALLASEPVSTIDISSDQESLDSFVMEEEPIDESPEGLHDVFGQPTLDVFTACSSKK